MLNLRARQYEPGVMRFSQRDVWHGRIKTPTTQNRYLYCINDPIGYYDRSGKRVEEGAGKTVTITPSKTPVASTMPTSAYTMAQIARAEAAGNTGIDKTNLTAAQKKIVEAAEKTLREKALSGTLTEREKQHITKMACAAVKDLATPMLELPEITPYPGQPPLPQPAPSPDTKELDPNQKTGFDTIWKAIQIIWKSLEIDIGVGFGLGAVAKALGIGASLLARHDFLVISLDDGKLDIGRRQSAEVGISYLAVDSTYYGQDTQSYITGEEKLGETGWKNTISLFDASAYLLVGGELSINLNPTDLFNLLNEGDK